MPLTALCKSPSNSNLFVTYLAELLSIAVWDECFKWLESSIDALHTPTLIAVGNLSANSSLLVPGCLWCQRDVGQTGQNGTLRRGKRFQSAVSGHFRLSSNFLETNCHYCHTSLGLCSLKGKAVQLQHTFICFLVNLCDFTPLVQFSVILNMVVVFHMRSRYMETYIGGQVNECLQSQCSLMYHLGKAWRLNILFTFQLKNCTNRPLYSTRHDSVEGKF